MNETEMNIRRIVSVIQGGLDMTRRRPREAGDMTPEEVENMLIQLINDNNITDPNEQLVIRTMMLKLCNQEEQYVAPPLKKRLQNTNTLSKKARIEAISSILVQAVVSARYRGHIRHVMRLYLTGDTQQENDGLPKVDSLTGEIISPDVITFRISPRTRTDVGIYLSECSYKSLKRLKDLMEPFGGVLSV